MCSTCCILQSKLLQIIDAVFPNPVYSFSRFIAKISTVKITTEEKNELHLWAVRSSQLRNLNRFLFPALVCIRKVAGGLCFKSGKVPAFDFLGMITASIGILICLMPSSSLTGAFMRLRRLPELVDRTSSQSRRTYSRETLTTS